jgi:hypothetical protein
MVIILILAAVGGVLGGIWLKRRHRRKRELIHRDSMLRTSDAAGVMRNRHPPSSVTQMPRFRDSSASLGVPGPRGGPPGTSGTGTTGRITSGTESLSGGAPSTPASASERRGKARPANVLEEDRLGGESASRS